MDILGSFPKTRTPLPPEYEAVYEEYYALNRAGGNTATGIAQRLESWMHRQVASLNEMYGASQRILEIGCGNLNHLKYEIEWSIYDAVEPFVSLYENNRDCSNVSHFYKSVAEIAGAKYDRVISVAVLEHMTDLPTEIALCANLLDDRGTFQAGIPCEGELAWYLGWNLSTGIAFKRRYGLNYSKLMHHEHVNRMKEITSLVRFFFQDVKVKRSPLPLPLPNCSFYAYIEARDPNTINVETVLRNLVTLT